MEKQEKYSSFKYKFKFVANVLSWTVFVLLILIAGLLVYYFVATRIYAQRGESYKPAFGLYTIVSPSMEPNLNIYDVIVNVNVQDPEDIKVGDVITFVSTASISKGMTITHRVVSISEGEEGKLYQTKGDNNLSPDSVPVPYKNVLGKVIIKIPQLGRLQSFLATKGGWLVIVVIPALLIIISDVLKLFRLQDAQKNVSKVAKEEETRQFLEKTKKKEIEEKLSRKLKPQRKVEETDPLSKKMVIKSVGNVRTKAEPKKSDLPKLKKVDKPSPPKKKRTYRRRRSTDK